MSFAQGLRRPRPALRREVQSGGWGCAGIRVLGMWRMEHMQPVGPGGAHRFCSCLAGVKHFAVFIEAMVFVLVVVVVAVLLLSMVLGSCLISVLIFLF